MEKKIKIFGFIFLISSLLISCTPPAKIVASMSSISLEKENLIALNEESVEGKIVNHKKQPSLFYWFTDSQRATLAALKSSHGGAAVEVTICCDVEGASMPKNVKFGFLYASNFAKGENYTQAVNHKPQVGLDFSMTLNSIVNVSMCIPKIGEDVVGFYVSGETSFHLQGVAFRNAKIGWDVSTVVPSYSFGVNGGKVDFSNLSANFDGGKKVFDTGNGTSTVLPKIEIGVKSASEVEITDENSRISFKYGSEELSIKRSPSQNKFTIQTSGTKEAFSIINLTKNASLVKSVVMTANSQDLCPGEDWIVDTPFVTDLGLIVQWPQSSWRIRTYELFRWEQFPDVLLFDFSTYKIQNEFFTRIAYFVEKKETKGTLVSDEFVEKNHGYNAHDYRAEDLARFFNAAHEQGFRLNKKEKMLCKILLKNGILYENGDGTFKPGVGAVVSMAKESGTSLRFQLMAHEAWHGIYFTDEDFRNYSDSLYRKFNPLALDFLKSFFTAYDTLQYDVDDEYLMKNEFMAYMLQQSPSNTGNYFSVKSTWVKVNELSPDSCQYVHDTEGRDFEVASELLSEYVLNRWGCWGGRTHLITRK